MEWTSDALILATRKHGEADLIVEVMTPKHGRHLGMVRAGRSRRQVSALQPGNSVRATWKARLGSQLGQFRIELLTARTAGFLASPAALYGLQHLAAILRLLPERDSHPALYEALLILCDHLDEPRIAAPLMVKLELQVLSELGFGLDLERCAATGRADDLAYVSPKSGRAVSREAGQPYHDRMLPLPGFLVEGHRQRGSEISFRDILAGFDLASFFLERVAEGHGHARRSPQGVAKASPSSPGRAASRDTAQQAQGPLDSLSATRRALIAAYGKAYRIEQPWDFLEIDAASDVDPGEETSALGLAGPRR